MRGNFRIGYRRWYASGPTIKTALHSIGSRSGISTFNFFCLGWYEYMLTLYFCLDGSPSVLRYWSSVPRIGDTIALPELGGNLNPLRVYDIIWEGTIEPSITVYVHHAKVDHAVCNDVPHAGWRDGYASEYSR